ncbi:WG repeat-containing protein [Spirosoma endbachense]|uniref:WG repeat-containing protein n=1 Tax=Spirosoma endbachense TaxID=2666025 RepID=A0A6P1VU91_9BACT|nr:WG repeat-containing protein [Spirosoma endbachense]QHV95317.1 hypothetical protein GJR95_09970 [Spirosoma endbachense]
METTTSKKWYNKVWLVVFSGLTLFPINLFILLKNQSIKRIWKVILFLLSPLFTALTVGLLFFSYISISSLLKTKFEESAKKAADGPIVFYDWNTALAGYKNADDEIIIPAKFDYAGDIVNGSAVVCQDGKYGYIDKEGNQLLPFQFDDAFTFNEGVAVVKQENKWMVIDSKGQPLKTLDYDSIYQSDTLFMIKKKNLYGCLNTKGEEIIKPEVPSSFHFRDGLAYFGPFKDGIIYMDTRLKPALIINGTQGSDFSEGLSAIIRDGKVGFINLNGELVIPAEYDVKDYSGITFLPSFSLGLACVHKNGKYGFINKQGEIVIPLQFDHAYDFNKSGITTVTVNKKQGVINTQGDFVLQPIYESVNTIPSGINIIRAELNGKFGFVDKTGKVVRPFIYDLVYDYNDGRFFARQNGKWALLDQDGKQITPFHFENVYGGFEEGVACVQLNGKYGYISKSGKLIIDFKFDKGGNFNKGKLGKYQNDSYFIYNKKGREIGSE